jgi:hypothetical protein
MTVDDLCMGCMEPRGDTETCVACGWIEGRPPANPVHLPPRAVLRQHYVLGRVLGHGGFGIAYLAWDPDLQMKVAVKEYLPGDVATRGSDGVTVRPYSGESQELFEYGLTKFLEEGRAVVRFHDHPGIASVLGFFRENGTGYLVMQYLDGLSFMDYLKAKDGRISYDEALAIAMPVLDTLRVVHEGGLLHRDISPHNIYITRTKQVKLLDFGAARHALGDRSKSLSVILKAGYSPFEQYLSKGRQGPWTDVYAVAATLYRAIAGEPPPESPSRLADDELAAPSARGVIIPAEAEAALLKALAVDWKDRYHTVAEFQQALLRAAPQPLPRPPNDHIVGAGADARHVASAAAGASATAIATATATATAAPPIVETLRHTLRSIVDRLERPARMLDDRVRRITGLTLAPDADAAARAVGLAIGLVAGLFGLWGGWSLLSLFVSVGLTTSGFNGFLMTLRVFAGLVCCAAMTIGGAAGLAGDTRGATVMWAAICGLCAASIVGVTLQTVMQLPQTGLAYLPAAVSGEIGILMRVLALPLLSLALLWLRVSPPRGGSAT